MRQTIIALAAILAVAACGGSETPRPAEPRDSSSPSAAAGPSVEGGEAWIAAQPHSEHLVLIRPDGSGAVDILGELPFEQFHPDWAPDGDQLAFEHAPEGPDADARNIWISDADGTHAEPLVTSHPAGLEGLFWANPAWSPDGSALAMVGYEGNASLGLPARSVLAVVDFSTRKLSVVSEYESANNGNLHSNPRWSNDGTAFVFTLDHFRGDRYLGGAIAVIEQTATGWSEPELITDVGGFADHADWHPTKDLIVFCTYDYGAFFETEEPSNLYTIRPDGSQRTQITDFGPGEDRATQPTWTSDGRIIFTRSTGASDDEQRPAFIRADGSGIEVVDTPENLVYPRLRPTT